MTELERKINTASEIHSELKQAHMTVMMKTGQLDDLIKDIAVTHLGYEKDVKDIALPELLKRVMVEARK